MPKCGNYQIRTLFLISACLKQPRDWPKYRLEFEVQSSDWPKYQSEMLHVYILASRVCVLVWSSVTNSSDWLNFVKRRARDERKTGERQALF